MFPLFLLKLLSIYIPCKIMKFGTFFVALVILIVLSCINSFFNIWFSPYDFFYVPLLSTDVDFPGGGGSVDKRKITSTSCLLLLRQIQFPASPFLLMFIPLLKSIGVPKSQDYVVHILATLVASVVISTISMNNLPIGHVSSTSTVYRVKVMCDRTTSLSASIV